MLIHRCMQARRSLEGSAEAGGRKMSLKAIPEVTQDDDSDSESDGPDNGVVELAQEAAEAFEKLDGFNLTRMARVATGCVPRVTPPPRPRAPVTSAVAV